jgi:hypothetical protein
LCAQFVKVSIDGFDTNSSELNNEALIKSGKYFSVDQRLNCILTKSHFIFHYTLLEIFLKSAIAKNQNEYIAINTLLVSLGLLKKEDGKYETIEDLRGPLSALTHSVQYLSPQQKHVLRAFMNRFANQYFKNFQFFFKRSKNLVKFLFYFKS